MFGIDAPRCIMLGGFTDTVILGLGRGDEIRVELTRKPKTALDDQICRLDGVQPLFDKRCLCLPLFWSFTIVFVAGLYPSCIQNLLSKLPSDRRAGGIACRVCCFCFFAGRLPDRLICVIANRGQLSACRMTEPYLLAF